MLGNVCVQTNLKKPHSNEHEVNGAKWNLKWSCSDHFYFSE